ncbi:MAG: 16S rRNA (guanine(527)-N(7))-methyltransferase RsmG [Propionibacteriaceae bacterium]|nr:16S rRNA (guanine(527)-N(7))-methyltransferase RsmG [Propionibacteriaceae bacterium]
MDAPAAATAVFGDELPRAVAFAEFLATHGVERGLLGPREVDRIWERHVLNSVAVGHAMPEGATVVDVGSGAGLPGMPVALARPDLQITLLEPLLRRSQFLEEAVEVLDLGERVRVVRGRAVPPGDNDPLGHHERYDVVTSRAVAALPRLLGWCVPLMNADGRIVALKGATATDEINQATQDLRRHRLDAEARSVVTHEGAEPTWLVVCTGSHAHPRTA